MQAIKTFLLVFTSFSLCLLYTFNRKSRFYFVYFVCFKNNSALSWHFVILPFFCIVLPFACFSRFFNGSSFVTFLFSVNFIAKQKNFSLCFVYFVHPTVSMPTPTNGTSSRTRPAASCPPSSEKNAKSQKTPPYTAPDRKSCPEPPAHSRSVRPPAS